MTVHDLTAFSRVMREEFARLSSKMDGLAAEVRISNQLDRIEKRLELVGGDA